MNCSAHVQETEGSDFIRSAKTFLPDPCVPKMGACPDRIMGVAEEGNGPTVEVLESVGRPGLLL